MSFSQTEEQILKFWQDQQIFQKSLQKESPRGRFVFYDGPPFATGLPHYGHIIASAIKDVIPRYQTMRGHRVDRRWGWDCHGLPIENLIEKELELKTKEDIEKLGIDKFNAACRQSVLRYADEWKKFIPRMARWVDMENDYETMDNRYIEVIWWIFKQLHQDGLIYEGYKSMHLCPRCETTLSNFEVTLGYQDVKDIAVTVKFRIRNQESRIKNLMSVVSGQWSVVYLLAWTTTPWTLLGNLALAVGPSIKYQVLSIKKTEVGSQESGTGELYIVAKDRVKEVMKEQEYEVISEVNGSELVGLEYEPVFDFTAAKIKDDPNAANAFKVYAADFVSVAEGTGIVHVAPAFGEDDYQLSQKNQIPFLQHVNEDASFKDYTGEWAGKKARYKDDEHATDIEILKWLALNGKLFAKEKVTHSYPFCWRCDTPLLNYSTSSWFVKVTAIKDKLLAANDKVTWVPEHLRAGRFGKWLEGARDWAISRSRYWGAPLPVWRCQNKDCGEIKVIGSISEIVKLLNCYIVNDDNLELQTTIQQFNNVTMDLHRPSIDQVKLRCEKCSGEMKRVSEVFDCWFESGSMPYASEIMFSDYQLNADTSREDILKKIPFPADFIAEGIDQTRGWFYTLMVLGVALYNESPFKNVAVNGIILAEDGQKMSKRLKNYPDPMSVIDKYGADALRFYLLSSPAVRGETLNFSEKGVDEVYKKVILISLNVLSFWKQYADGKLKIKNEKLKIQIKDKKITNILDQWIMARLEQLREAVTVSLDKYEIDRACREIPLFIDDLSTWYLRRSRDRFKDENEDQTQVILTLGYVLQELAKIIAPVMPFLAEHLYQNVKCQMSNVKSVESVHLEVWPKGGKYGVGSMEYSNVLEQMAGVRQIVEIGHRLRAEAGVKVRQGLGKLKIKNEKLKITIKNLKILLELIADELNVKEVELADTLPTEEGWISVDDIALYTVLDDGLKEEGLVRELTRQINNLRKQQGLTINDQVTMEYATDSAELVSIIEKNKDELGKNVLAREIREQPINNGQSIKVDEQIILINLIILNKSQ